MPLCCCRRPSSWAWGCCSPWSASPWSSTTGPARRGATKATETGWEPAAFPPAAQSSHQPHISNPRPSLCKFTEANRNLQDTSNGIPLWSQNRNLFLLLVRVPLRSRINLRIMDFFPPSHVMESDFLIVSTVSYFPTLLTRCFVTSWSLRTLKT